MINLPVLERNSLWKSIIVRWYLNLYFPPHNLLRRKSWHVTQCLNISRVSELLKNQRPCPSFRVLLRPRHNSRAAGSQGHQYGFDDGLCIEEDDHTLQASDGDDVSPMIPFCIIWPHGVTMVESLTNLY